VVSPGTNTVVSSTTGRAREIAAQVLDPELPVLTIEDLGILRDVEVGEHGTVVTITPTYSGCPAMDAIRDDVLAAFAQAGWSDVRVAFVLAPAWTTDWMSEAGRRKLEAFGIAPPRRSGLDKLDQPGGLDQPVMLTLTLRCPQCGSPDTRELSRFGSTACKSLWVCGACREPFDHFKTI
jgi:ring-1,2-phenylacetyl-CoA epoxidase subunit PaaD